MFLDSVSMRQYLSDIKPEIKTTTKGERNETWRLFVENSRRDEC